MKRKRKAVLLDQETELIPNNAYITHRALRPEEAPYMTDRTFLALKNYITKRAANKRVTMGNPVPRVEMIFGTRIPYTYMTLPVTHLDGHGRPVTEEEIAQAARLKQATKSMRPMKTYCLQTPTDAADREISQQFLFNLLEWVRHDSGLPYRTLLVNVYEDGSNSVGAHSDDEKEIIKNADIYSFSYGAGRFFHIRTKKPAEYDMKTKFVPKAERHPTRFDSTMLLRNNELVVMRGNMQKHFAHAVPKLTSHPETGEKIDPHTYPPRINITFRLYKGDAVPDVPQVFLRSKLDQYIRTFHQSPRGSTEAQEQQQHPYYRKSPTKPCAVSTTNPGTKSLM